MTQFPAFIQAALLFELVPPPFARLGVSRMNNDIETRAGRQSGEAWRSTRSNGEAKRDFAGLTIDMAHVVKVTCANAGERSELFR